MKRIAALAVSLLLLSPAVARADDDEGDLFLAVLNGHSIGGPTALNDGYAACYRIRAGESVRGTVNDLWMASHGGLSYDSAAFMVDAAENILCPDVL